MCKMTRTTATLALTIAAASVALAPARDAPAGVSEGGIAVWPTGPDTLRWQIL
jgi:hypothetical protein